MMRTKNPLGMSGFTLIEIMVVVLTLGILAAIVVPKFAGASTEASIAAAGEDILSIASALEHHHTSKGYWPADTSAGASPPEVLMFFKGDNPFEKPCPIGSLYNYDNTKVDTVSTISISLTPGLSTPAMTIVNAQALDAYLDDGVLNTGRFQSTAGGYSYRISP